jgi:hypothetical protein
VAVSAQSPRFRRNITSATFFRRLTPSGSGGDQKPLGELGFLALETREGAARSGDAVIQGEFRDSGRGGVTFTLAGPKLAFPGFGHPISAHVMAANSSLVREIPPSPNSDELMVINQVSSRAISPQFFKQISFGGWGSEASAVFIQNILKIHYNLKKKLIINKNIVLVTIIKISLKNRNKK